MQITGAKVGVLMVLTVLVNVALFAGVGFFLWKLVAMATGH